MTPYEVLLIFEFLFEKTPTNYIKMYFSENDKSLHLDLFFHISKFNFNHFIQIIYDFKKNRKQRTVNLHQIEYL